MTTTYDIPMPNDVIDGRTIIASAYLTDEDDEQVMVMLMVLNPQPPFYTVVETSLPVLISMPEGTDFSNIIPAAEFYQQESSCW